MQPYEQLELEWAKFNDLDPAGMVACASGTAALHLALEAFRLPQESEVITSDFNMIAVPRAISMAGLTPVFVDCDERLLMDCSVLQVKHLLNVEAIMAVHIYGRSCNMEAVHSIKAKPKYPVIEDLAEAHGVKPHPQTDAAAWSFYRNKIVAGEEGGAVWFRDPAHAEIARELRCLGFTKAHDFMHVPRGWNHRMSNAHAELILKSIGEFGNRCACGSRLNGSHDHNTCGPQIMGNYEERTRIEEWYDELCPDEWRMPPRDAPWVYDLRIKDISRATQVEIVKELNENGIQARMSFAPMLAQKEYADCRLVITNGRSAAKVASREVSYLPIQPGVTTRDNCRKAFDVIHGILGE